MEYPQSSHRNKVGHGDRLSSLPDPILVDILSLLPTKTAVTTGVLCHRWRGLWTQTLNLDLDTRDFPTTKETCNLFTTVDHILRQLTSPQIRRFKFHIRDYLFPSSDYWVALNSYFGSWMSLICGRNVEEFEVISYKHLDVLKLLFPSSSSVFKCQSLVSLKLNRGFYIRVPDETNLPNLKKLFLWLSRCDGESLRKLFRSCPLLEELSLQGSFSICEGEHFVDISSAPNLKRLTFKMGVVGHTSIKVKVKVKVAIDAPKLSFFDLSDFSGLKLWFVNQPSSSLEMHISGSKRQQQGSTLRLFQENSNVRSLTLDSDVIKTLDSLDDPKLRTLFRNLSRLSLSMWHFNKYKGLLALLHSAPNLEFLSVRMPGGHSGIHSILSDSPPTCLLTHVKRIQIELSRVLVYDSKLMKSLLCNANVLECLVVKLDGKSESGEVELQEELELYEELCKLPKSSPTCQIKFCGLLSVS